MPCLMSRDLSLFDTAGLKTRTWYVVYHHREPYYWFTKFLKPGFRHVEAAQEVRFGPEDHERVWLNLLPTFELLDVEISTDPRSLQEKCPTSTVQKVTTLQPLTKVRSWFDIGPPSCVEVIKMALGIRAFFVRTPWQLFRYIQRRGGVIDGRRR